MVDMELQEAKDYVLELMKEKDKVESEIKALTDVLKSNRVGMEDPLIDSEGYPRSDIDVYQVRHIRHKIRCLGNDHKALMNKIEEGLHKIHALTKDKTEGSSVATSNGIQNNAIQVEDLILEFGSIDYQNFKSLKDIGTVVQNSKHMPVNVKIKHGSNTIALTSIPYPWAGNSLLGCNTIPVDTIGK